MADTLWLDQRFLNRPEASRAARPAAALKLWRALKLAETLDWATRFSPWYARLIPADLKNRLISQLRASPLTAPAVLEELPFTAAADLAADSDAFLSVGHDEVEGIVTVPTSGTGGPAKRIRSTAADQAETISFFKYGMRFLVKPGRDRVALAMSRARPGNVADLLGQALTRWGIPFQAFGFVSDEKAALNGWLDELAEFGPTCLVGVPPQMLTVSRHEKICQLQPELATVLLSGDVAGPALIKALANNFRATVYRHYGSTESGLGGAVECGRRNWPHLRDDLWAEIIDEDGRPVTASGQAGEIVLTALTRRAMPLIRYRTGDEGALLTEPCGCGSIFPRLITFGRLTDRFQTPNGRRFRLADFEPPLLTLPFLTGYDVRLSRNPPTLTVFLKLTSDAPAGADQLAEQVLLDYLAPAGFNLPLKTELLHSSGGDPGGKRRLITVD